MIGVISDTHGLLRPKVLEILKGVDLIIHAGDIGGIEVLNALETIAPVKVVRGNNDRDSWADHIPHDQVIEYGSHLLYVLHELEHLDMAIPIVLWLKPERTSFTSTLEVPALVDSLFLLVSLDCISGNSALPQSSLIFLLHENFLLKGRNHMTPPHGNVF
jgi:hypothetical protein